VSLVKYELGFISQKTAFFIVTAVKTSNLTQFHIRQQLLQSCGEYSPPQGRSGLPSAHVPTVGDKHELERARRAGIWILSVSHHQLDAASFFCFTNLSRQTALLLFGGLVNLTSRIHARDWNFTETSSLFRVFTLPTGIASGIFLYRPKGDGYAGCSTNINKVLTDSANFCATGSGQACDCRVRLMLFDSRQKQRHLTVSGTSLRGTQNYLLRFIAPPPTTQHSKTNSVAFSPQANYADCETATCRRNLVPTFADRGMSRGQRG
jgi:hypothetical protein